MEMMLKSKIVRETLKAKNYDDRRRSEETTRETSRR